MFKSLYFLVFVFSVFVNAQEKLVIIGGGSHRPPAALRQFAEWAGQKNILIIAWASQMPEEAAAGVSENLKAFFTGEYQYAYVAPVTESEQSAFANQLAHATGVFFTGGDQVRIMSAFKTPGGQALKNLLTKAYEAGAVFGGTSAGTAIMSPVMIEGGSLDTAVRMGVGLGFAGVDPKLVLDQHFSQRQREGRLMQAMKLSDSYFGFGIDEDTAFLIEDRVKASVVGENRIRCFTRKSADQFSEMTLVAGDHFNLQLKQKY